MPLDAQCSDLEDLVERAQRGDREAFAKAYEQLYPRVWTFVARRRAQRSDIEDVVSRTFHRFLSKLDSYKRSRGTTQAFVLAIARNLMIDEARGRHVHVSLEEVCLANQETPSAKLLRDEELRLLQRELASLDPNDQELLVLRYGDGLRCGEVADLLGIGEDAVKQRLSRLLRRLRRHIERAVAEPEGT